MTKTTDACRDRFGDTGPFSGHPNLFAEIAERQERRADALVAAGKPEQWVIGLRARAARNRARAAELDAGRLPFSRKMVEMAEEIILKGGG